jgi:hypothetical protein
VLASILRCREIIMTEKEKKQPPRRLSGALGVWGHLAYKDTPKKRHFCRAP